MHLGLPLQEPAQPATFPERLLINSWVLELCHPLGTQFESGTCSQLEEGLPRLAGLQTQGLWDSRGGNAYINPPGCRTRAKLGYTSEVHPAATWRLMCFVQRTTCRQKGSSQTQGLWTRVVRKTVSVGSLERCLRHGDQQLSSSRAVHGPPTRGHSLYHGTRLALVSQKLPLSFGNLNLSWTPGANGFRESWCRVHLNTTAGPP